MERELPPTLPPEVIPQNPGLIFRFARWVSWIFSPPLVTALTVFFVAEIANTSRAFRWAALEVALGILLPVIYIGVLLKKGHITDAEIYIRRQRVRPYLVTLVCSLLACLVLAFGQAPIALQAVGLLGAFQMLVLLVVNLVWKISAHAAAVAGFCVLVGLSLGQPALLALLGIPLIIWSRVYLHRHTLGQTLAGTALGSLTSLTLLNWIH